jgi:hypothetical protein
MKQPDLMGYVCDSATWDRGCKKKRTVFSLIFKALDEQIFMESGTLVQIAEN